MKHTLKKIKARLLRPLTRYIESKAESIVLYTYEEAHSEMESKIDNCVSLDWFSEEIEETNAFQELKSEVEMLRADLAELYLVVGKMQGKKGESNE